jgi:hypothetical protein
MGKIQPAPKKKQAEEKKKKNWNTESNEPKKKSPRGEFSFFSPLGKSNRKKKKKSALDSFLR